MPGCMRRIASRYIRATPNCAASAKEIGSRCGRAAATTRLRALVTERVQPGVVYTTFHHPESRTNDVMTDHSDWATNCPEFKVTAVQVAPEARSVQAHHVNGHSNGANRLAIQDNQPTDIHHLVRMANDIGAYFAGYPRPRGSGRRNREPSAQFLGTLGCEPRSSTTLKTAATS